MRPVGTPDSAQGPDGGGGAPLFASPDGLALGASTPPDPAVERYARAAAGALSLPVLESWWPSVLRHVELMHRISAELQEPGDAGGPPR